MILCVERHRLFVFHLRLECLQRANAQCKRTYRRHPRSVNFLRDLQRQQQNVSVDTRKHGDLHSVGCRVAVLSTLVYYLQFLLCRETQIVASEVQIWLRIRRLVPKAESSEPRCLSAPLSIRFVFGWPALPITARNVRSHF